MILPGKNVVEVGNVTVGNNYFRITPFSSDQHYIVNHYIEELYDLNSTEPHQYELYESENLTGMGGELTTATAKTINGFTAQSFEQVIISTNDDTVVDIYYQRNCYQITLNQSGNGFNYINGAGEYLYGAPVEIIAMLNEHNDWYTWQINECDDVLFMQNFKLNLKQQSFIMPATNLVLTAYSQPSVYLISVKITGQGSVTPEAVTAHYGDRQTFRIKPNNGYNLQSVLHDGLELVVTESDGIYQVSLPSVTGNTELSVNFVKVVSDTPYTWVNYLVWVGGGVVSVILFGGSAIMLMRTFRAKKFKL